MSTIRNIALLGAGVTAATTAAKAIRRHHTHQYDNLFATQQHHNSHKIRNTIIFLLTARYVLKHHLLQQLLSQLNRLFHGHIPENIARWIKPEDKAEKVFAAYTA